MAQMTERGKIRNREQAKQLRDFSGLKWGTITPTDIDGFFEINNEVFIFIEIKFKGISMPYGQRLALERLIDILQKDKNAVLIMAKHNDKPNVDLDAAKCKVIKYRFRKNWMEVNKEWELKDFCDWFIESVLGYLPK